MVEGTRAFGEDFVSGLKAKVEEEVSLPEAMHAIIHGSSGLERQRFPQIDMVIVFDILSCLARSGRMTSKQLANRLNCRPKRDTLRKYFKILVDLGLISVDSVDYCGVAKTKKFSQDPEKGKGVYLLGGGKF